MYDKWSPATVRRAGWIAAGVLGAGLLLPALPAMASAFSGPDKAVSAPSNSWLARLEVVGPGIKPGPGQINQPAADTTIYVGCATGHAVSGGYNLPEGLVAPIAASTPSEDLRRWNFRFPGVVPAGTGFYAVCS